MDKSTLKELVKSYFGLVNAEDVTKQSFVEAELIDDTKITNMLDTDFEVGQELHVITEEGEHVLAPVGQHETKSGIILTVTEEGVISGVKHPDQEGEGSLLASKEKMAQDGMVSSEDLIEAISELVMPELESMKKNMTSCMARLDKAEEMMAEYKERMSEEPAAMSAQQRKFAALEKVKASKGEGNTFNPKAAQLEAVLSKIKKNK